ncbi:MAG: hypothetical protein DHS80DRAFT_9348, partial [Piptocephalis tieghemiana]
NIIEKPQDWNDNVHYTIQARRFSLTLEMPFLEWETRYERISFRVDLEQGSMRSVFPLASTMGTFTPSDPTQPGSQFLYVSSGTLTGTYQYARVVEGMDPVKELDTLSLNVMARQVDGVAFGHLIRYLIILRDNYFGMFTGFATLSEYQDQRGQ